MLGIVNIVIPATSPATNLAKTVANTSYSLLEYLHGMPGVSGSSPLGSIYRDFKSKFKGWFITNISFSSVPRQIDNC